MESDSDSSLSKYRPSASLSRTRRNRERSRKSGSRRDRDASPIEAAHEQRQRKPSARRQELRAALTERHWLDEGCRPCRVAGVRCEAPTPGDHREKCARCSEKGESCDHRWILEQRSVTAMMKLLCEQPIIDVASPAFLAVERQVYGKHLGGPFDKCKDYPDASSSGAQASTSNAHQSNEQPSGSNAAAESSSAGQYTGDDQLEPHAAVLTDEPAASSSVLSSFSTCSSPSSASSVSSSSSCSSASPAFTSSSTPSSLSIRRLRGLGMVHRSDTFEVSFVPRSLLANEALEEHYCDVTRNNQRTMEQLRYGLMGQGLSTEEELDILRDNFQSNYEASGFSGDVSMR